MENSRSPDRPWVKPEHSQGPPARSTANSSGSRGYSWEAVWSKDAAAVAGGGIGVPLRPQFAGAAPCAFEAECDAVTEALEIHVAGENTSHREPVDAEITTRRSLRMTVCALLARKLDAARHDLERVDVPLLLVEREGLQCGGVAQPTVADPGFSAAASEVRSDEDGPDDLSPCCAQADGTGFATARTAPVPSPSRALRLGLPWRERDMEIPYSGPEGPPRGVCGAGRSYVLSTRERCRGYGRSGRRRSPCGRRACTSGCCPGC